MQKLAVASALGAGFAAIATMTTLVAVPEEQLALLSKEDDPDDRKSQGVMNVALIAGGVGFILGLAYG